MNLNNFIGKERGRAERVFRFLYLSEKLCDEKEIEKEIEKIMENKNFLT